MTGLPAATHSAKVVMSFGTSGERKKYKPTPRTARIISIIISDFFICESYQNYDQTPIMSSPDYDDGMRKMRLQGLLHALS